MAHTHSPSESGQALPIALVLFALIAVALYIIFAPLIAALFAGLPF